MGFRCCLRFIFALLPACVTCLENYEGSMPAANVQRISTHNFPMISPELKQAESWNDPVYRSVQLPHRQDTHGSFSSHKGRLVADSDIKSDSKDCQNPAKSDNQEDVIKFNMPASGSKYDFSGFAQPSAQYESRTATDAFQPSSQLASTSSQSWSTLMRTLKVPDSKLLKPSNSDSSYTKLFGSSSMFVVKPPKNTFGHSEFNSEVTRNPYVRDPNHGPTSISSPMSYQHSSSTGIQLANKVQIASSSYGPLLKGTLAFSRKPSSRGLAYTSSIVSSGPVFLVQSYGGYSGLSDPTNPFGVPCCVDLHQTSQSSRDTTLTASSQGKSWNEPLQYSMSGPQYSPSPELREPSKNDYRDNIDKSPIVSAEILLHAPERANGNHLPPHYETAHPKFQQTHNVNGWPSQNYKPMYPFQGGTQYDVAKSSIASSGSILIMQDPTNVQSRTESNAFKAHPGFPEHRVTVGSGQTVHLNQPFKVTKEFSNVQPATSTYDSSSRTGYKNFSSVHVTSYKPYSRPSKPSNEITSVHVRLNKLPTSSFSNFQNQWASGGISSDAFQSSLPPSYRGQRPGQNKRMPVSSSAPRHHVSKVIEGEFTAGQDDTDQTRLITTAPSKFGQGAIRRLFPTLPSSYRQAEQNQHQVYRTDSSASKCEGTRNSPVGLGHQSLVTFQEENPSI